MHIKIILSYNGSSYEGSQVQLHTKNTIMGQLYEVFKSLNIHSKLHASGRTDAGVHAFKQVMHCEVPSFFSNMQKLKDLLNHKLPPSIQIRHISPCSKDFHSRYSAKRRVYRYVLSEQSSNPFEDAFITFISKPINLAGMQEAIILFEGEHDFSSFKKSGSVTRTNIRTIYKAKVYAYKNKTILYFEANGFLRSQIRLMVAFLLKINEGNLNEDDLSEQLENIKIHNKKPAPANGLYLSNIIY
ncbi:tRNA pseudouridine(38-40) synthase TruA [Sulfurimonas sp. MAG313]|nr:tRNA pseudouridine(38-40) synthase TruA [Sulfurimonas sp. MAG313]MDF1879789.1 tRNA pseudouridine(38-40) synthase TruA [Sulfurimonas sp. MAG313]